MHVATPLSQGVQGSHTKFGATILRVISNTFTCEMTHLTIRSCASTRLVDGETIARLNKASPSEKQLYFSRGVA